MFQRIRAFFAKDRIIFTCPGDRGSTGVPGTCQEHAQNLGQVFWDVLSTISESSSLSRKAFRHEAQTSASESQWTGHLASRSLAVLKSSQREVLVVVATTRQVGILRSSVYLRGPFRRLFLLDSYRLRPLLRGLPYSETSQATRRENSSSPTLPGYKSVKITLVASQGPLLLRFALCAKACESRYQL